MVELNRTTLDAFQRALVYYSRSGPLSKPSKILYKSTNTTRLFNGCVGDMVTFLKTLGTLIDFGYIVIPPHYNHPSVVFSSRKGEIMRIFAVNSTLALDLWKGGSVSNERATAKRGMDICIHGRTRYRHPRNPVQTTLQYIYARYTIVK